MTEYEVASGWARNVDGTLTYYAIMDDMRYDDIPQVWNRIGGKVWTWSRRLTSQELRRMRAIRRHRQRCSNLNNRYPQAHPFGWPEIPIGQPLPRPWKKAR